MREKEIKERKKEREREKAQKSLACLFFLSLGARVCVAQRFVSREERVLLSVSYSEESVFSHWGEDKNPALSTDTILWCAHHHHPNT